MSSAALSYDEFLSSAKSFIHISNSISDGWTYHEEPSDCNTFLRKYAFITHNNNLYKSEYVIYYNISYAVPSFSFNIWDSSGVLLTLEEVRKLSFLPISEKGFYSVVTQQEHPIFHRPYFIMHPCHTEELLQMFKNKSKNIIVTFLGLISPLIRLNLPLNYGQS